MQFEKIIIYDYTKLKLIVIIIFKFLIKFINLKENYKKALTIN